MDRVIHSERQQYLTIETQVPLVDGQTYALSFFRRWDCQEELIRLEAMVCDCTATFLIDVKCDGTGDIALPCGRYCMQVFEDQELLHKEDIIVDNVEDMSLVTNCGSGAIDANNLCTGSNTDVAFTTSWAASPGCNLASQSLTFTIEGQVFGPFTTLPQTFGPLVATANAGLSFTVSGTIASHTVTPDGAVISYPLEVTEDYEATGTICGSDTSQATCEYSPIPVRGFVNSDDTTQAAILIATGGSIAADTVTDISNDATAFYTDEFNLGPCGSESAVLFTISGNAGDVIGAASFSGWNAAFTAPQQATIIAAFAGTIGNPGYAFDKEIVRDEWVAAGILNSSGLADGDLLCIHGDVAHLAQTSAENQFEIQQFCETVQFSIGGAGVSGPFNPFGGGQFGITSYRNELGAFNSVTVAGTMANYQFWESGTNVAAPPRIDWDDTLALINTTGAGATLAAKLYTAYNEVQFASVFFEDNNGLQSYGNLWATMHDNPVGGNPDFPESSAWIAAQPVSHVDDPNCTFRILTGLSQANASPDPSTIAADDISPTGTTVTVQRYPIGTPGIVVSGTENPDPALGSIDPLNADFAPGGVLVTTEHSLLFGFLISQIDNSGLTLPSGDLYFKHESIGTTTGLPYEFFSSARLKLI